MAMAPDDTKHTVVPTLVMILRATDTHLPLRLLGDLPSGSENTKASVDRHTEP